MAEIGHNAPPAVIDGSYADFKLIKTRAVAQIFIEIPIEEAERFIGMFGIPKPGTEIPVAVARLQVPAPEPVAVPEKNGARSEAAKEAFALKSAPEKAVFRAVKLCENPAFWEMIGVKSEEAATEWMYRRLGIKSRAEIATNMAAYKELLNLIWQFENQDNPHA